MSLLSIVQKFCLRTAVPKPVAVMGNTDPQVAQILTLLEEECEELNSRTAWKALTNEATFLTKAQEDQGTLASLGTGPTLTNGLRYILNKNMWNRTSRVPVFGPVPGEEWQALKAISVTGPWYQYRIRGVTSGAQASLLFNPAPPAGNTVAFEYVSDNWCLSGTTPASTFQNDTDTVLFPESIVLAGLRWRFKREKGLTYTEDFNSYERMVTDAIARDGTKRTLDMSGGTPDPRPGIWVPAGNWPL